MAKIYVTHDQPDPTMLMNPTVEVVEISEVDGIYGLVCTGDDVDRCPSDLEPGDTWSNLEDAVQAGLKHIHNHEKRR